MPSDVKQLTDADLNPIYKRRYSKLQDNTFATYGNVWGMLRKTYGQSGDEMKKAFQVTFGGGVGSSSDGTLPLANLEKYIENTITWKRTYANIKLDGLAMAASMKSEGAFVNLADKGTINKMKSFNRYLGGNILFNDGSGTIGQFSGSASGTAAAPVITVLDTAASTHDIYRKAFWEVGDTVNVNTLSSAWTITAINRSTKAVTLSRTSGSDDLTAIGAGTHTVYMQNSKDVEPYGFKGIIDNSTHYGTAEEYRYSPTEVPAGGAELEDEMLIELIEKNYEDTDEYFDTIVLPPGQFRKYLMLQEDKKRIPTRMTRKPGRTNIASEKAIAKVSYNGIALAAGDKDIMLVSNRFVQDNRVYAFNSKYIEVLAVGKKPGFQAQDGKVFLRIPGFDHYGAFLAFYGEILINPFYVGAITGLARPS